MVCTPFLSDFFVLIQPCCLVYYFFTLWNSILCKDISWFFHYSNRQILGLFLDLSEYDYFTFLSNSRSYNFFLKNKDLERYLFIEACGKIVDYVPYLCTFAPGGQKWVLDRLELELQVVVSCWMWVLVTKQGPLKEQ